MGREPALILGALGTLIAELAVALTESRGQPRDFALAAIPLIVAAITRHFVTPAS